MRSFLSKKSITRTLLLGAVSAAFVLPSTPAHAAAAATGEVYAPSDVPGVNWTSVGSCVGQSASIDGNTMTLAVEGQAVASGPAIDVAIVCHAYVNGGHVGARGGVGVGPVGAVAGAITGVPIGPYSFCVELHVTYPNGSAHKYC